MARLSIQGTDCESAWGPKRLTLTKRYIDGYLGILQDCTEQQVLTLCDTLQERPKVAGLRVLMSHSN